MNKHSQKRRRSGRDIMGRILFFSLVFSAAFSLARVFSAPTFLPRGEVYTHLKSDYSLMFLQCILGLLVLSLPSILSKKWQITIPNFIYVLYYIFLYCAIFLGEVLAFYYLVPHWDTILHFFSGAMLGALGFILVELLNDSERVRVSLSPFFVALFAFCFALAAGAVWEIYEFTLDSLLGMNMQKHTLATGTQLIGPHALADTMKDLIMDALSALIIAVIGYLRLKKRQSENV